MIYESREGSNANSGLTLVELLVVMTILGIVGGIVTTGIVRALDNARVTQARIDALQELEIAGQRVARELRAAEDLILAKDFDEGDPDPENPIPFEREVGAVLLRDGTAVDADTPATIRFVVETGTADEPDRLISNQDGAEQVLVTLVDLDIGEPVFRYLDRRGEEIACGGSCALAYLQTELVEVVLARTVEAGRPPVVYRTQVAVRNVRFPTVVGS